MGTVPPPPATPWRGFLISGGSEWEDETIFEEEFLSKLIFLEEMEEGLLAEDWKDKVLDEE